MQERVATYHDEESRFVDGDHLFRAAQSGPDLESLYMAREELAREAASLHFARLHAVPGSREMGRLATRRIAALREIAFLTVAIARVDTASPAPERLARIMGNLVKVVDEAAAGVLSPEAEAKFTKELRARLAVQFAQLGLGRPTAAPPPAADEDE